MKTQEPFNLLQKRLTFFGKAVFGEDFGFRTLEAPGTDPELRICRVVSVSVGVREKPFYWGIVEQDFGAVDSSPVFHGRGNADVAGLDVMLKDVLRAVFECKMCFLDLALQDQAEQAAGQAQRGEVGRETPEDFSRAKELRIQEQVKNPTPENRLRRLVRLAGGELPPGKQGTLDDWTKVIEALYRRNGFHEAPVYIREAQDAALALCLARARKTHGVPRKKQLEKANDLLSRCEDRLAKQRDAIVIHSTYATFPDGTPPLLVDKVLMEQVGLRGDWNRAEMLMGTVQVQMRKP
jgi:hypothetical protein